MGPRLPVIRVRLLAWELAFSEGVARRRQEHNRTQGVKDRAIADTWEADLRGARAEMAFCKGMNCYWGSALVPDAVDAVQFGIEWEVRSTPYKTGHLVAYERTPNRRRCALVVESGETEYHLVGWAYAADVKRPKFWRSDWPSPAYAMPQEHLHRFADMLVTSDAWRSTETN